MKTATIMILPNDEGFTLNMSILNVYPKIEGGKEIDYAKPIEVISLSGSLQSILNLVEAKKIEHGI